ncbi:MAG: 2-C-methyl-D-erythritol 2,4-cyclodiphosphate synthase [Nitrospirota bacterium]|jgi:2-C-methyl-D-erythritol 2,4-cyclodiphosphate synthase
MRIGFGYDSHRFAEGRKLVLGGVEIPHERGLLGHSDGDALTHAVIDALLGAAGLGDIGRHFPDTDPAYKGAVSTELLRSAVELVRAEGYEVAWIDSTVVIEEPMLAPHIESIRRGLAVARLHSGDISVKAKRNEGMGFVGRREGVAAFAVCLLRKIGG